MNIPILCKNKFEVIKKNKETGEQQISSGYNTLTKDYLSKVTQMDYFSAAYIQYGKGSGTPDINDTQLFQRIGGKGIEKTIFTCDYEKGIASASYSVTIPSGTITGNTLTEVGLQSAAKYSTGDFLINHSMLSTPVVVGDLDDITINATIYIKSTKNFSYLNGCLLLNEFFLKYILGIGGYNGLVNSDFSIRYTYNNCTAQNLDASRIYLKNYESITMSYDQTTRKETIISRFPSTDGNLKPFGTAYADYVCYIDYNYKTLFRLLFNRNSPFILAEDRKIEGELIGTGDGIIKDYQLAWDKGYDLKLYINEVLTNDYTFDEGIPYSTEITNYFDEEIHTSNGKSFLMSDNNLSTGVGNNAVVGDYSILRKNNSNHVVTRIYATGYIYKYYKKDNQWVKFEADGSGIISGEASFADEYKVELYNKDSSYQNYIRIFDTNKNVNYKNIHFNVPPAQGAVITANYLIDGLTKTENNVFDTTLTFSISEYTGEI